LQALPGVVTLEKLVEYGHGETCMGEGLMINERMPVFSELKRGQSPESDNWHCPSHGGSYGKASGSLPRRPDILRMPLFAARYNMYATAGAARQVPVIE
jgi:hypothetical protein